ncbi:MAG: acriflavin resistance protein, partial [Marivirga sp.]|nr:acriflavin resistance protein [Marivirga sp.]
LFVCYTITPWLASRFGKVTHLSEKNWLHRPLIGFESFLTRLTGWYTNQLKWTLNHKLITGLAIVAAFVATAAVMNMGILGQEMVASGDRGKILFKLEYDKSTSLTENSIRSLSIETYLLSQPEVKTVFSNIGGASTSGVVASVGSENKSELNVGLVPVQERKLTSEKFMLRMRNELERKYPGLQVNSVVIGITKSDEPIQIVLNSENSSELFKATRQLESMIKSLPGANDVTVSVEDGSPELTISLDREKMEQFGLSAGQVGETLQNAYTGNTDAKFRVGNNEYNINVRFDEFDRSRVGDVENISFINTHGDQIMLSQFASLSQSSSPSMLERKNRRTSVTVKSNVLGITSGTLAKHITQALELNPLPSG